MNEEINKQMNIDLNKLIKKQIVQHQAEYYNQKHHQCNRKQIYT